MCKLQDVRYLCAWAFFHMNLGISDIIGLSCACNQILGPQKLISGNRLPRTSRETLLLHFQYLDRRQASPVCICRSCGHGFPHRKPDCCFSHYRPAPPAPLCWEISSLGLQWAVSGRKGTSRNIGIRISLEQLPTAVFISYFVHKMFWNVLN